MLARYHKQAYQKMVNINKTKLLEGLRIEDKRNFGLRSSFVLPKRFPRRFAYKIDPAFE